MQPITLRYFASARAAAGVENEVRTAASPRHALNEAAQQHGPELQRIIDISSYLLNGTPLPPEEVDVEITEPATLDVLPPFAGG